MRILVTGGAGYIGSAVSAELVRCGHHVIVLDNLSSGHRGAVSKQAMLIQADVGDRVRLGRLFAASEIDGVMHFAASIDVKESMLAPAAYFRNNRCFPSCHRQEDMFQGRAATAWRSPILIASSEQIKKELGWKPKVTELEQIIQSAWERRQR